MLLDKYKKIFIGLQMCVEKGCNPDSYPTIIHKMNKMNNNPEEKENKEFQKWVNWSTQSLNLTNGNETDDAKLFRHKAMSKYIYETNKYLQYLQLDSSF